MGLGSIDAIGADHARLENIDEEFEEGEARGYDGAGEDDLAE